MHAATTVLCALERGQRPAGGALRAVLQAACRLDDVAWHPTGFVVGRLDAGGGRTLRLHVWPDDERVYGEPLWPFHDHVFSLRSLVLAGLVGSRRVEVVDDAVGRRRRYAVDYGADGSSRLVAVGDRVTARVVGEQTIAAGSVYGIEAGEFHASAATEGRLAATLVATDATARQRPFVLGPASGPAIVAVQRVAVAATRWRELVARVHSAWHEVGLAG